MKKQKFPFLIVLFLYFINVNATVSFTGEPIIISRHNSALYIHLEKKIHFDYNQIKINKATKLILYKLAKQLLDNKDVKIEIQVYTDTRNNPRFSLNITQQRADRIKEYLVLCGVNPNNLFARGYGDTNVINKCKPFVKCTEAEHDVNRRVAFKILNPEKLQNYKFLKKSR